MAALSDREILEALDRQEITITPFIRNNVQPGSIDLTLGSNVDVWDCEEVLDLDPSVTTKGFLKDHFKETDISAGYELKPGEFVKGHSAEEITLPSYINGAIFNRNSLAGCGLDAAVSQYINPGFHGNKIIVIRNLSRNSIILRPGIKICQLILFRLGTTAIRSYSERHDPVLLGGKKTEATDNPFSRFMEERIAKIAGAGL